ncbi:MAG: hypothetical protein VKM34_04450 [Cyanobacteriota bacterium]|nr:hypothetical protein [Cyanobacteriota bacterium]
MESSDFDKGVDLNCIVDAINGSHNHGQFPRLDRLTLDRVLQALIEGEGEIEKESLGQERGLPKQVHWQAYRIRAAAPTSLGSDLRLPVSCIT